MYHITSGIPQGKYLRPLQFLAFIDWMLIVRCWCKQMTLSCFFRCHQMRTVDVGSIILTVFMSGALLTNSFSLANYVHLLLITPLTMTLYNVRNAWTSRVYALIVPYPSENIFTILCYNLILGFVLRRVVNLTVSLPWLLYITVLLW